MFRLADPTAAPKGLTTVIVVILFIGGIQLLCLAIIGSYLAHMYEEVKGRPSFIVESILNRPTAEPAPGRPFDRVAETGAEPTAKPNADEPPPEPPVGEERPNYRQ